MDDRKNEERLIENFNAWAHEFYPVLGLTQRWNGFQILASELFQLHRPVTILETGCTRVEDNWHGDGQSTRVFEYLAKIAGGSVWSVDIDPDAIKIVERLCPNVNAHAADSITFLTSDKAPIEDLDLLYLDSFDYQPPYAHSELHHAGELAAVWHRLKSGCLVAVDDCHGPYQGKQVFVKLFFERLGVDPLSETYITIWRKP